jgi:4-azaleucine resistance transporter AzlC
MCRGRRSPGGGGNDVAVESRLRDGARAIAPIGLAAVAFGVSFGLLARTAGMGAAAAVVMSATTFAGSAQFAAASVLDDGGTVVAAVVAAVLLNARYAPMSVAVAPAFRSGSRSRRLLQSQLIVDESWAFAARPGGQFDLGVLFGAGLLLYPCWVGGTALGALGARFLGNPDALGLDAAFPALFLALLATQLGQRGAVAAALLGGSTAFVLIPVTAPGVPIIAASLACLVGLVRR